MRVPNSSFSGYTQEALLQPNPFWSGPKGKGLRLGNLKTLDKKIMKYNLLMM